MKLSLLIMLCVFQLYCSAQNNTITVNALQEKTDEFQASIFKYPSFQQGWVVFRDSLQSQLLLNYNRVTDQIYFLNNNGDTLVLAKPETYLMFIIGNDTFHYHNKGFVEQRSHFDHYNLHVKQSLKYIGREKKGAYGTYSATTSVNSNSTYTNDDNRTDYISIDENSLFKFNNEYFISDKYNNFYPANKKGIYNFFSKK